MTDYLFRQLSGKYYTLHIKLDTFYCYEAIDQLLLELNNSECKGDSKYQTEYTILDISIIYDTYILDIYDLLNTFENKEFNIIIYNNNNNKMVTCKCTSCDRIQSYNSLYMGHVCVMCDSGLVIPETLQITKHSGISCDIPYEYLGEINIIEWNIFRDTIIKWQQEALEYNIGFLEYEKLKDKQEYDELSKIDEKILWINNLF